MAPLDGRRLRRFRRRDTNRQAMNERLQYLNSQDRDEAGPTAPPGLARRSRNTRPTFELGA